MSITLLAPVEAVAQLAPKAPGQNAIKAAEHARRRAHAALLSAYERLLDLSQAVSSPAVDGEIERSFKIMDLEALQGQIKPTVAETEALEWLANVSMQFLTPKKALRFRRIRADYLQRVAELKPQIQTLRKLLASDWSRKIDAAADRRDVAVERDIKARNGERRRLIEEVLPVAHARFDDAEATLKRLLDQRQSAAIDAAMVCLATSRGLPVTAVQEAIANGNQVVVDLVLAQVKLILGDGA